MKTSPTTSPVTRIEADELHATLRSLAKEGGVVSDFSWMRKPGNAKRLMAFLCQQQGQVARTLEGLIDAVSLTNCPCGRTHSLALSLDFLDSKFHDVELTIDPARFTAEGCWVTNLEEAEPYGLIVGTDVAGRTFEPATIETLLAYGQRNIHDEDSWELCAFGTKVEREGFYASPVLVHNGPGSQSLESSPYYAPDCSLPAGLKFLISPRKPV
jgi:hypothetical protein